MSAHLQSRVWFLELRRRDQIVLQALADHAHDDGSSVYPSVGYTAWKTGYDERTVQRALRSLEASGLLVLVAEAGRHRAREYRIDLRRAELKPPYRGDESNTNQGRQVDAPRPPEAASDAGRGVSGSTLGAAPGPPKTSGEPSEETSDSSSAPAREPAEEKLPGDFPDELRPALETVWPVIERVAQAKPGSAPPTREAVARAIASFPDRDHVDAATDLEQWLVNGTGRKTQVADVVQSFRRTLARGRPAPTEPADDRGARGERQRNLSRYDEVMRR